MVCSVTSEFFKKRKNCECSLWMEERVDGSSRENPDFFRTWNEIKIFLKKFNQNNCYLSKLAIVLKKKLPPFCYNI